MPLINDHTEYPTRQAVYILASAFVKYASMEGSGETAHTQKNNHILESIAAIKIIAQQQDIKQAQRCFLCTFNKTIAMRSKRMENEILK